MTCKQRKTQSKIKFVEGFNLPLALALMSTFSFSNSSYAELASPTAGSSGTPWATEQSYCDGICPSLANESGKVLGLSGDPAWSTSDDQWCANHGQQTSPTVLASPAPIGSPLPNIACKTATLYPGDTSCPQVTTASKHCVYHNSQVESYCMAYEGAHESTGLEDLLLSLDIAATGICATACAASSTLAGPAAFTACMASSTAASAAEILGTLTQKSSPLGKIADAALAAAGVAEGVSGLMGKQGLINGSDDYLNPGNNGYTKKMKKNACITAVALAALTGVRYYNKGYAGRTQKSSCGNIWNLQSSSSAIGTSTSAFLTGSGSSGTVSSGSTAGTSSGTSTGESALSCMGSGASVSKCTNPQISAATDGGLLSSSGLATPAAQAALQNHSLSAAGSASRPSSAMGGALGNAGDLGKALAKIADTADEQGQLLASIAPFGGGGGGGGSGGSDAAAAASGSLFSTGDGAATAPIEIFRGDGTDSTDIWHSHTDRNLFQIISGRIGKSTPKIGL